MRGVKVTLVASLALIVLAVALTLLGAPMSIARTNRPPGKPEEAIEMTHEGGNYCDSGEVLPRDTSAIRFWLEAAAGPRVTVAVRSHGRELTGGERGSGWIGGSVTVPVRPLARTISDATVCISFVAQDETVTVQESYSTPGIWIEYLRPGTRSWASMAVGVARHMGLGRAVPGTWIVLGPLALLGAIAVLASRLLVKELR